MIKNRNFTRIIHSNENLAPHHFAKKHLQPTATIQTKLNYRCSIIESPFSITVHARILRLLSMEPKFFAHWRGNRRIPEDREGQRSKHLSGSAETSSNSNKESRRVASNEILPVPDKMRKSFVVHAR